MTGVLPVFIRLRLPKLPALWLPFFVLWPLIALAFALLVPVALLWPAPRGKALAALAQSFHVLCALRGTRVTIRSNDEDFDVSIH